MSTSEFAQGTHRLGWDMIRKLGVSEAATLSPLSATIALAMVAGAATPDAEAKFQAKLGVKTRREMQQSCKSLLPAETRSEHSPLAVANALFYEADMKPTAEYAQYLEAFNVQTTQYAKLADSVNEINRWVAQNTRDLIQNLLNRAVLAKAGVALINALAFKGTWETQFDKEKTVKDHPFTSASGKTSSVDMMFQHNIKLPVAYENHYTAVSLPYKSSSDDTKMSLIAYLPSEGTDLGKLVEKLAKNDTPQFNTAMVQKFGFPRFEVETGLDLKEMLDNLGYPMGGSFPALNGVIGPVIHRAIVKLDEEGTVAAAATAVIMSRSRAPKPNVILFDRPFAFSIKTEKSNIVVFTGVYTKD